MDIFREFCRQNKEYGLIREGDRVICGVSGGADSVCMLLLLKRLGETLSFLLRAVHVHHGLREAASEDEAYVRELCGRLEIPLYSAHTDAAAIAAERGMSVEEAGRAIRYEIFAERREAWIRELSPDGSEGSADGEYFKENFREEERFKIAVAHHMEDRAETVLFHLCRGTSLTGAAGIRRKSGCIIRPILFMSREQIETYLRAQDISWREDESNRDAAYTRNYLRLEIMPRLKGHINPEAAAHICALSEDAEEASDYLRQQALAASKEVITECREGVLSLDIAKLTALHRVIGTRVLRIALSQICGREKDLTRRHTDALFALCGKEGCGEFCLPYGVKAVKEYGALVLEKEGADTKKEAYEVRIFTYDGNAEKIPTGPFTKWLDYGKMAEYPVFRVRMPGDVLQVVPGQYKKLARFMIDEKIPERQRTAMILPFIGNEALWVPGYRMNAGYKITEETKQVMEIRFIGNRKSGSSTGGGRDVRENHRADQ